MEDSGKKGRQASINGHAHEHIVIGILMKKYHNVSKVDLPLSPYDLIIALKKESGPENIIRAQVKTAVKSVSFTGGSRGGIDREYKSGVKTYRQSTEISDLVIGIHPSINGSFKLYFIPTILIEQLNKSSISINKIKELINNYEILENCKNRDFVIQKCQEYGII